MSKEEKENRINSLTVTFLEQQQIIPHPLADQIISAYKEGYNQAEKDLELTWKDIEKICLIAKESHKFYGFWSEIVYDDILKRFKERKETKD